MRAKNPTLAEQADPYILYQQSVQCAEAEIDFVDSAFLALRARYAQRLREDFCGTAQVACEWVRRRQRNTALAIDIDPKVLDWGRRHNVNRLLHEARSRVKLINADVMKVRTEAVDAVLAMNFSYWFFKQRETLRRYFRRVRAALGAEGLFFLDAYGGYDAFRIMRERTRHDGYTYVWHQAAYNPITGEARCHIDFKFDDGSVLKQAFSYEYRLWTLPEIREVLLEAGFSRAAVYWQGTDEETGEANG
ncbi:MAG: class I SAM-dependent methyltransferase, partial [Gammaproteobacteria bacterium]